MIVAIYLKSINKPSQQTDEQTKVIKKVVSAKVSKLNHCNEPKIGKSNTVFYRKKTRKRKMDSSSVNRSHRSMDCLIKKLIRQIYKTFSSISKCFSCNEERAEKVDN